jgi:hypothetical protein
VSLPVNATDPNLHSQPIVRQCIAVSGIAQPTLRSGRLPTDRLAVSREFLTACHPRGKQKTPDMMD